MTAPWLPKPKPWHPPDHDDEVVAAVRAVEYGNANEAQQRTFWRYLMYVTGASEEFADLSFRSEDVGGARATDFAEGKRFVGLMIRKLLRAEFTPKPEAPAIPPTIQQRLKQRREANS
jgi:hypothetical protein